MASHRRASAFVALLGVLLLVVMPCTTTGAAVAAEDDTTLRSYVDYFIGDLFQNPSSMNGNNEPKAPPRFRPWRIMDVPDGSTVAFDCMGDVPTLHVVPCTGDCAVDNTDSTPPLTTDNTCGIGGAQAGTTTPTQYKFSRPDRNTTAALFALFWGPRPSAGDEGEGAPAPPPLLPVPKFQLKAILKAVAALMESSWRHERGDGEAVPESVAFSNDMVVFYFRFSDRIRGPNWLVAMGREDVEFLQPWERLHGEIKALNLGSTVV